MSVRGARGTRYSAPAVYHAMADVFDFGALILDAENIPADAWQTAVNAFDATGNKYNLRACMRMIAALRQWGGHEFLR